MHRLEDDHLEAIAPLGIRTAIDLRSSEEVGRGTFTGGAVRHLPIFEVGPTFSEPIEDVARTLADAYLWMLSEGPGSIRAAIELLGEPRDLPALVYCAAGKDRTGVVVAIVLRLLGAEREVIAADYALSDAPAAALRAWHLDNGTSPDQLAAAGIFRAPAAAMELFLDSVDAEFGSLDGVSRGHRGRCRAGACPPRRRAARRAVVRPLQVRATDPGRATTPKRQIRGRRPAAPAPCHTGAGYRRTAVGGTPSRLGKILAGGPGEELKG